MKRTVVPPRSTAPGEGFTTYAIRAEARRDLTQWRRARLASGGDIVIIAASAQFEAGEMGPVQPRLVFVNERSCRVGLRTPIPLQSA